jgi:hypothetical protein
MRSNGNSHTPQETLKNVCSFVPSLGADKTVMGETSAAQALSLRLDRQSICYMGASAARMYNCFDIF